MPITRTDALALFEKLLALPLDEAVASVSLASSAKGALDARFERLQLSGGLAVVFQQIAGAVLAGCKRDRDGGHLLLREYQLQSRPEPHEVEFLCVPEVEALQGNLHPLGMPADIDLFQEDPQFVAGLRFYAISLLLPGYEPVHLFRRYSPRKQLGRSRLFAIWYHQGVYDRFSSPLFLFDEQIDCINWGGIMFVLRKESFHEIFRVFEYLHKVAQETLAAIQAKVPIANFDEFARDCEGHVQKMAKLRSIAAKPYWSRVSMSDIDRVIARYGLPVQIVQENGQQKLLYDPKDKWVILRLLDDDYLHSTMTDLPYEVTGKREL